MWEKFRQGVTCEAERIRWDDKTLSVGLVADITCSDVKCGGQSRPGGQGSGDLRRLSVEFEDVVMTDDSEWLCRNHLGGVLSINRRAFVPTDTLLKWKETCRGDKDLLSLCESNLKVPLRGLSLGPLKSGGMTAGWAQTHRQEQRRAFLKHAENIETELCLRSAGLGPSRAGVEETEGQRVK